MPAQLSTRKKDIMAFSGYVYEDETVRHSCHHSALRRHCKMLEPIRKRLSVHKVSAAHVTPYKSVMMSRLGLPKRLVEVRSCTGRSVVSTARS